MPAKPGVSNVRRTAPESASGKGGAARTAPSPAGCLLFCLYSVRRLSQRTPLVEHMYEILSTPRPSDRTGHMADALARMPLHDITETIGTQGLRERFAIEVDRLPAEVRPRLRD